jgi:G3E family GTPase
MFQTDFASISKNKDGTFYIMTNGCGCCSDCTDNLSIEEVIKEIEDQINELKEFRDKLSE